MKKLFLTAAMTMIVSAPALAETDGQKTQAMVDHYFTQIDTNGDGLVSKAEHDAFTARKFTEADTNNDGSLSKEEVVAQKTKEKSEWKGEHKR